MSLLEHHKSERRNRILAAARRLIAERGFDALNMRELARRARVSVPTLYNLFGGKHQILAAELGQTVRLVAGALQAVGDGDVVERAFALVHAGTGALLAVPDYYRQVVHSGLTSPAAGSAVRPVEHQYIALMADTLRDGQAAGQIVDWVDAEALARTLFASYMTALLRWARGDLDDERFRATVTFAGCLMLAAVCRGKARRARLEEQARAAQALAHAAVADRSAAAVTTRED